MENKYSKTLELTDRYNQVLDAMDDFMKVDRHAATEILNKRVRSIRHQYGVSSAEALDKIMQEDRNIASRLDV